MKVVLRNEKRENRMFHVRYQKQGYYLQKSYYLHKAIIYISISNTKAVIEGWFCRRQEGVTSETEQFLSNEIMINKSNQIMINKVYNFNESPSLPLILSSS